MHTYNNQMARLLTSVAFLLFISFDNLANSDQPHDGVQSYPASVQHRVRRNPEWSNWGNDNWDPWDDPFFKDKDKGRDSSSWDPWDDPFFKKHERKHSTSSTFWLYPLLPFLFILVIIGIGIIIAWKTRSCCFRSGAMGGPFRFNTRTTTTTTVVSGSTVHPPPEAYQTGVPLQPYPPTQPLMPGTGPYQPPPPQGQAVPGAAPLNQQTTFHPTVSIGCNQSNPSYPQPYPPCGPSYPSYPAQGQAPPPFAPGQAGSQPSVPPSDCKQATGDPSLLPPPTYDEAKVMATAPLLEATSPSAPSLTEKMA